MITTKDILDSLKVQTECPKCGANWKEMEDSLWTAPYGSDDWLIAVHTLRNCQVCKTRFKEVENGLY